MEHLLAHRARTATSSAIRDLLRVAGAPHVLSLAGGLPAPELFPVAELRAAVDGLLASPEGARRTLQYGPTEGDDELRELVAAGAGTTRSCVVITTGSQQAIDLLARTLLDPGDAVVVESPAYLGALQALHGARPRIVPVAGDAAGLDVDRLRHLLTLGLRPKLCYLVPNFSNPSGATLPEARRRDLAQLADQYGFLVVEDDPYGELRFTGGRVPPVRAFGEHVVTLGSSSKTLAPGLRVGWAIAPERLVTHLVTQKQSMDLHTSSLGQAVVAQALDAAWYPAHLDRLRHAYRTRALALHDALGARAGVFTAGAVPDGGMFVWVRARGADTASMLPHALERGVAFVPGAAFAAGDRDDDAMRLSFATLSPDELRAAVDRLADVFSGSAAA